ncbi:hypothetical protein JBL43_06385 [Aureibaculum sp. A20]|uniref:DUF547 domain-containing protein n=1 Tax=Aureibaculum flavum TaxID=2795986 RepID=A0ABS0WPH5_9FLAO|nr:hypothetical protein [Aureibaculum flavum]MBJ2173859.1 hypothetical protein [Aureibaculum flavum]
MKSFLILLAINFSCICNAQKVDDTNKAARKIYQKHLSLIKRYFKEIYTESGFSDDSNNNFEETTTFLVILTKLDCYTYSYEGCEASEENYLDWKAWYKLNRKKLYLERDTVKIKGNPISVRNNPIKYFKKKLKLVKKSIKNRYFEDPPYIDAIVFLINLTEIKDVYYDEESDLDIPTSKQITFIENWFKKNKNKLYWDVKTHSVKLK